MATTIVKNIDDLLEFNNSSDILETLHNSTNYSSSELVIRSYTHGKNLVINPSYIDSGMLKTSATVALVENDNPSTTEIEYSVQTGYESLCVTVFTELSLIYTDVDLEFSFNRKIEFYPENDQTANIIRCQFEGAQPNDRNVFLNKYPNALIVSLVDIYYNPVSNKLIACLANNKSSSSPINNGKFDITPSSFNINDVNSFTIKSSNGLFKTNNYLSIIVNNEEMLRLDNTFLIMRYCKLYFNEIENDSFSWYRNDTDSISENVIIGYPSNDYKNLATSISLAQLKKSGNTYGGLTETQLLDRALKRDFFTQSVDNIHIKFYLEKTEYDKYEYDFLTPVSISIPDEFLYDFLNPTIISIKEDIISDLLNPISVNVFKEMNKDLFLIEITVDAPIYQIELGPEFRSGWDDRKYLIFRNGTLLPKQTYNITIPSPFNNYAKKILYTTVGFSKEDRIEVFYIENQQNFANVPFNRETRVASYIYYARTDNQKLIKVPYPNSSYRRSKDAFILFNDKGEHLDIRYDYTVSMDGRYVTLADHAQLEVMMQNYVVFTFCYVDNKSINGQEEETDMFDTINISEIKYKYSYSIKTITNLQGTIKFTPAFDDWPNMIKENFMLFGNSVFIDPERYEIVSNDTIQFVDPSDAAIANYRRYTMCIPVKETKPKMLATNQVRYEVVRLEATKDDQATFILTPPNNGTEWYPFLVFRGSRLMDVKEEYIYDEVVNILKITDPSCYLKKGRHLTLVFLNKSYTDLKKENKYIKMQFTVDSNGMTEIPKYLYKNPDIKFDPSNLLLFLNGVFLEPERWSIESGNWIKMNSVPEVAGYDPPYEDKTYTAIYLIEYADPDSNSTGFNDEWGQKEIDPSEDNDEVRFDELYAYVKKKPS